MTASDESDLTPRIIEEAIKPELWSWTIHNPRRANALSPAMLRWIANRALTLDGDVVLLRSSGSRCFSSGFDLSYLDSEPSTPGADQTPDAALIACAEALREANACFVADCRAPAFGAGVELLCLCDFVFCTPNVTLAVPAGKLGVVYHYGGIEQFQHRLGPETTRRLLLLGEVIGVQDPALAPHLRVVEDPLQLEAEREGLLTQLFEQSPLSRSAHARWLRRPRPSSKISAQTLPREQEEHERLRRRAYQSPAHQRALAKRRSAGRSKPQSESTPEPPPEKQKPRDP